MTFLQCAKKFAIRMQDRFFSSISYFAVCTFHLYLFSHLKTLAPRSEWFMSFLDSHFSLVNTQSHEKVLKDNENRTKPATF